MGKLMILHKVTFPMIPTDYTLGLFFWCTRLQRQKLCCSMCRIFPTYAEFPPL